MTTADYLHYAFLLAKRANFKLIRPNPFVGAIIVDPNGQIIGEGYHQKAGEAHAEVLAIKDALLKKDQIADCTLYVTLEPCSHFGKTPPCTDIILKHKIWKVVIGSMDPNPKVSGAELLKEKGVLVELCILPEIVELNNVFNINQTYNRPKYILKSATTLNGFVADRNGNSKWISNAKSRAYVHSEIRSKVDAILTTAQTIIHDNASMNMRIDGKEPEEISVIIIDKNLDLLKKEYNQLNIFYKRTQSKIYLVSNIPYEEDLHENIEIINPSFPNNQIDFNTLNQILLSKNICAVLVEGGGVLNASLMKANIVDELYIFICPNLLLDNSAKQVFNATDAQLLDNASKLSLIKTEVIDSDVMLQYLVLH
jgi:diaminohydroxyphosphoribosylaminopyrimidine deaminase/5-amino-6-(5-phosphoribosylamino)uracil reductase